MIAAQAAPPSIPAPPRGKAANDTIHAILEWWQTVQGIKREVQEIFPRDLGFEIRNGDDRHGTKVRLIDSGHWSYWLYLERPDGQRYGEVCPGPPHYWIISDELGIGRLPGQGQVVDTLRKSREKLGRLDKAFRGMRRFPDQMLDGRRHHLLGLQLPTGGSEHWWIDAEQGVLRRVDTLDDANRLSGRVLFRDFRSIEGVMEPFETVIGEGPQRVTIRTMKLVNRVKLPPRIFEPTGAQVSAWNRTEEILKNYVKASGGYQALAKITSRVTKARCENLTTGVIFEMTTWQKAPDFFLVKTNIPGIGQSWQGFDGENGWDNREVEGFRTIRGSELELFRRNGQLNLEDFPKIFPIRKTAGIRDMDGRKVAAIDLASLQSRAGTHYFDLQSGQLIRVESVLAMGGEGSLPVSIEFSDFRPVDNVVLPFRTELTNPALKVTTTIESVEQNLPIADTFFRPRKD